MFQKIKPKTQHKLVITDTLLTLFYLVLVISIYCSRSGNASKKATIQKGH